MTTITKAVKPTTQAIDLVNLRKSLEAAKIPAAQIDLAIAEASKAAITVGARGTRRVSELEWAMAQLHTASVALAQSVLDCKWHYESEHATRKHAYNVKQVATLLTKVNELRAGEKLPAITSVEPVLNIKTA